jgi:hypothetical protein
MTCNSTDYQFIRTPLKVFECLDNNCRAVLIVLIRLSNWAMNKGEDEDGWFYRSNALMCAETKLSRKVMDGALDALLKNNLIDFIPQPQGKGVNQKTRRYKVNYDAFKDFEQNTIEECLDKGNPKYQITTSDYKKVAFTWRGKEKGGKPASLSLSAAPSSPTTSTIISSQPQPKVPTNIDTKENKDLLNLNNNLLNINYSSNSITTIEGNSAVEDDTEEQTIDYKHTKNFLKEAYRNRIMDEIIEYTNVHQCNSQAPFNEAVNNITNTNKDFIMLCLKQVDTHGKMEKVSREHIYKAIKEQGIDNDYDFEQTFKDLFQYYINLKNSEQAA